MISERLPFNIALICLKPQPQNPPNNYESVRPGPLEDVVPLPRGDCP